MNCPRCQIEMSQVDRKGIAIHTCIDCGGIWLDKGKLGELLARLKQAESSIDQELGAARVERPQYPDRPRDDRNYDRGRHDDHDHHEQGHHGRKKGFFDIFD
jgi:Zn-finger nucleic acid-binding protein